MGTPSYTALGSDLRLRTPGGIRYEMMNGFPTYSFSMQGTSAVAKFRIHSGDLRKFKEELFPPPLFRAGKLTITVPPPLPGSTTMLFPVSAGAVGLDPGKPFDPFYADHASIGNNIQDNPLTNDLWIESYSAFAIVTVQYESRMPYNPDDPETFLKRKLSVGGEFLSLSEAKTSWRQSEESGEDGSFKYDIEPNKDFKAPIARVIPTIEHQLQWQDVIDPPWENIRDRIGRINRTEFTILDRAPPETVMFLGVTASQRFNTSAYVNQSGIYTGINPFTAENDGFTQTYGEITLQPWTLDYKFSERRVGKPAGSTLRDVNISWNYFFRPETGRFEILYKSNGEKVYETEEMQFLFERDPDNQTLSSYAGVIGPSGVSYQKIDVAS